MGESSDIKMIESKHAYIEFKFVLAFSFIDFFYLYFYIALEIRTK